MWEMTPEAEIVSTKFHKSIIKSRSAMTYEEAQNRIDDVKDDSAITKSLRVLLKLSRILKARRVENGSLVLASSEVRFNVDSETADPIDVQAKVPRETNSMVEVKSLISRIFLPNLQISIFRNLCWLPTSQRLKGFSRIFQIVLC